MIICCGEALIDMLPARLADGRTGFVPLPGGALFNTAIALGRLGEDAGFLSGLSSDMFGRQLMAHLAASGVRADLCKITGRPTTLAFVQVENGEADYAFFDENSAGRNFTVNDIPKIPDTAAALHFGGISLLSEPCGSAFEEVMIRHREQAVISLDPNIRTAFISDERACRDRLRRMMGQSDIIKVSQDDLAWLQPGGNFASLSKRMLDRGASLVILTRGEQGARVVTRHFDISAPARNTVVADTIGAGDAFNAGLLSALRCAGLLDRDALSRIDRNALRNVLDFAVRVAAASVSRRGADPPWRDEIEAGA